MTANQIAYHQNKLREEELKLKEREIADKEHQTFLKDSELLAKYGQYMVPAKDGSTYHEVGFYDFGLETAKIGSEFWKNIAGAGALLAGGK